MNVDPSKAGRLIEYLCETFIVKTDFGGVSVFNEPNAIKKLTTIVAINIGVKT